MVRETEMLEQFRGGYDFPPLLFTLIKLNKAISENAGDAVLEITSDGQTYEFDAEFKSRSSPRLFENALLQIENSQGKSARLPMIVVPYLRESQLIELQKRKISGLDLSGNGIVTIANRLLVYRTGNPNQFPDSAPTKYAYRGATSLVARVFLCRSEFRSLADIDQEIQARGGRVALSTISKALKRLESDLIVDRSPDCIRLLQADKLLKNLATSYAEPKATKRVTLSIARGSLLAKCSDVTERSEPLTSKQSLERLLRTSPPQPPLALSGRSSIASYAVMGRQDTPVLYSTNVDKILKSWGKLTAETSRFVDLELRQTDDPTVYFDMQSSENLPYASPIQIFLECANGDKREQETSNEIKDWILRRLNSERIAGPDG